MVYFPSFKLILWSVYKCREIYTIPATNSFFTDSPRHYHRHLNDAITSTAHNVRLGHDLGGSVSKKGAVMDIGYLLHRENGGKTRRMVPLIINPIYTLYIVGIYWDFGGYIPFKRAS